MLVVKSLGFEEKNRNFVSKQIYKVFKHNYEFQNCVKNLLKDFNKGEPLKEDVRKNIISNVRPKIQVIKLLLSKN